MFADGIRRTRTAGGMAADRRRDARTNPAARVGLDPTGPVLGNGGAIAGRPGNNGRTRIQEDFWLMKHDEFAFFNQQLAAMLRDGIPLEGALKQLSADMNRGSLRAEIQALE